MQSPGFSDAGGLQIRARQAGGTLFDDKGKVAIPPEVLTRYFAYLLDLAHGGAAPPPPVTIEKAGGTLSQSAVATNSTAFGFCWNTQLTALSAASGQKLKLLKLPGEAQAHAEYYKPSMFWSVSARSQHPAEAALLLDFLANDPDAAKIMLTDRGVPANRTIRTAIDGGLKPTDKAAADYLNQITVTDPPRVTPNGASTVETILKRHTEDVLFDRATPDKAAQAFIAELQADIDAAR